MAERISGWIGHTAIRVPKKFNPKFSHIRGTAIFDTQYLGGDKLEGLFFDLSQPSSLQDEKVRNQQIKVKYYPEQDLYRIYVPSWARILFSNLTKGAVKTKIALKDDTIYIESTRTPNRLRATFSSDDMVTEGTDEIAEEPMFPEIQDEMVEETEIKPTTTFGDESDIVGEPLNFRGTIFAPLNEAGTIVLFGMVAEDLGILYESTPPRFPDMIARRRIDGNKNKFERVRVEFEFVSSNFKRHKHPIEGCDIIICWEDDWYDCPLEVIELRSVIKTLKG